MSHHAISVHYQASELLAVPASHFTSVFARAVHRICSDPATRPEAVAVELGPETAAAARVWLQDLGVGPHRRGKLPVMLGLIRRNRVIRASFREKALRLQQKRGSDLSELPPDVLHRELGYAGCGLLCLSPVDSIIEAMRSALELEVPLLGVDLEEMADSTLKPVLVQDPACMDENLERFIERNAPYAEEQRDEEIDGRREQAMAARLKALLLRHKRVLFTCGLAHWRQILRLLRDPDLKPAFVPEIAGDPEGTFKRVVVHPLIAVRFMDRFPALAAEHEKRRTPAYEFDNSRVSRPQHPDPLRILEECLENSCNDYFFEEPWQKRHRSQDLAMYPHFRGYLTNLSLLGHRFGPDLFMAIGAAQETMSKEFVKALTKILMEFPWASPDEHPGCPVLVPPPDHNGEGLCARFETGHTFDEDYVHIQSLPANSTYGVGCDIPYEWERMKKLSEESEGFSRHTWAPWDNVISSMSLRAIRHAKRKRYTKSVEVFDGSMLDGIDVKSTLRACSRGQKVVYVRDNVKKYRNSVSQTDEGFPVVWILQPGEHRGADWIVLHENCGWMAKHVRDRKRYERVVRARGDCMVATIAYGDLSVKNGASDANPRVRCDRYYGVVLYQPICWTHKQFTHWAELTAYKRNPFCHDGSLRDSQPSDLRALFEKKHGVRMGEFDWATTLILLALPFAKDILTVVIPESYDLAPVVYDRTKRQGVQVCTASLGSFSREERERLSFCYMTPVISHEPKCVYSSSVEKAIGQSQTDYLDLVPQTCLDFGKGW